MATNQAGKKTPAKTTATKTAAKPKASETAKIPEIVETPQVTETQDAEAEAKAKAEQEAKEEAEAEVKAPAKGKKKDELQELADVYAKLYPDCDTFHITTDRQVFFGEDENLAWSHQRAAGEGEVRTFKVKYHE